MGREEQQQEREVLGAIFPEEITDVSEKEFRISIALDVTNEEGEEEPEPPIILLNVSYPEAYPDEAPLLDILTPPNAPKHPFLDIQEDKARLLDLLQSTIEDNMGFDMIFTLVGTLKDGAELLISERQKAKHALHEAQLAKAEEEENRKFHGTIVTRESFLEWREKFRKELEEEEIRRKEEKEAEEKRGRKGGSKDEKKMTGRELWEKGVATTKGDEDYEGGDLADDVEKLKVGA
ncbi:RWD-domain-containing protein [Xylona heveae TC161]|uniref:RWD-domain-containing protein n=1 Tax=Xylona heveae (strain CBS 132557 / TC161) TaxID=1328760 RepID=A0A165GKU5_XYLHT|nr:RWD-domain-containing protein [Xylona heveae TC161]KZF22314.1 RWD-domain-containing protein [Xylona heveae TC161]